MVTHFASCEDFSFSTFYYLRKSLSSSVCAFFSAISLFHVCDYNTFCKIIQLYCQYVLVYCVWVFKKKLTLGFGTPLASGSTVNMDFWASCCDMLTYSLQEGVFDKIHTFRVTSSDVGLNRNKIYKAAKEKKVDWLLMIDDDMQFQKDYVQRLLEVAKAEPGGVYAGIAFVGAPPYYGAFWLKDKETGRGQIVWDWPHDRPFGVDFVGGYGFLVSPEVLYSDKIPEDPFTPIAPMSEDHTYSNHVREAGFNIIIDPFLPLGHMRSRPVTEYDWLAQRKNLKPGEYVSI